MCLCCRKERQAASLVSKTPPVFSKKTPPFLAVTDCGLLSGLVRQAFNEFDVNGDGTLEASEFKRWAKQNPSVALWVSRLGHNVLSSLPNHISPGVPQDPKSACQPRCFV